MLSTDIPKQLACYSRINQNNSCYSRIHQNMSHFIHKYTKTNPILSTNIPKQILFYPQIYQNKSHFIHKYTKTNPILSTNIPKQITKHIAIRFSRTGFRSYVRQFPEKYSEYLKWYQKHFLFV